MSEIKTWKQRCTDRGQGFSQDAQVVAMIDEITELRARVADLEKDAGRYRWVRSQKALEVHRFMLWADSMPDLDEMIDKAMRVRQ